MDTQMPHHNGRTGEDTHDPALHAAGMEGEDHEKKSVMKKVKAKAKKIKDKLTPQPSHGHGGHDQQAAAGHDDEDDDDDDDEKMVQDPEIHGAPIHESAAIGSGVAGPGANTGKPAGGNYLERPSVKEEQRHHDSNIYDPPVRPFQQWQEENSGMGKPTETHEPHVPFNPNVTAPASDLMGHSRDVNTDQSKDKIGELPAIEEDTHAPNHRPGATAPSNYESKVTDPSGGGGNEAGITSIENSLDKMGIHDEKPQPGEETKIYTGSHDQFAPEQVPKSFNPDKLEELPRETLTGHQNPSNQSSYRDQISSATSAVAGKAVAAKDAIATKLGYTAAESNPENTKSASPTEYASKIAATVTEKLTPVYEKAAVVGNTVMSKVQGTGTGKQQVEKGPDKGVSGTTNLTERLKPGNEDKALSEVITHAFKRGNDEKGKEQAAAKTSGDGRPISEVVSDAVQKRGGEEEVGGEGRQLGKVTESEEVKRQLGTTGEEHERSGGAGGGSNLGTQKGMVGRLKGAVSSWMGKGGDEPQSTTGTTHVTEQGLSSSGGGQDAGGGERKLQEST